MKKILIIGRPNVGKSSLFNRLCGRRIAVVSDFAGTTRDVNFAPIELYGRRFALIDSGGLDDASELFSAVQKRTLAEAAAADVLLFMVDAKLAPDDADRRIFYSLLRLKKPTALLINKVDGKRDKERSFEFASFGARDVFALSVAHNTGTDELIDWLCAVGDGLDGGGADGANSNLAGAAGENGADFDDFLENFDDDGEMIAQEKAAKTAVEEQIFAQILLDEARGVALSRGVENGAGGANSNLAQGGGANSNLNNVNLNNVSKIGAGGKNPRGNLRDFERENRADFDENGENLDGDNGENFAEISPQNPAAAQPKIAQTEQTLTPAQIRINEIQAQFAARPIKVGIIGRVNVGKSSLLNALVGAPRSVVTAVAGTTIDPVSEAAHACGRDFVFVDTAGIRKRGKIEGIERFALLRTQSVLERSDIALLVLDASEPISELDERIAGLAAKFELGVIIVLNKWDRVLAAHAAANGAGDLADLGGANSNLSVGGAANIGANGAKFSHNSAKSAAKTHAKNHRQKPARTDASALFDAKVREIRERFKFLAFAPVISVSATEKKRTHKLFELAAQVFANYTQRLQTSRVNDVLAAALKAHPIPSQKGRRVRVFYGSQFGFAPPKIALVMNRAQLHFSYKRYLANQFREAFDLRGSPILFFERARGGGENGGAGGADFGAGGADFGGENGSENGE